MKLCAAFDRPQQTLESETLLVWGFWKPRAMFGDLLNRAPNITPMLEKEFVVGHDDVGMRLVRHKFAPIRVALAVRQCLSQIDHISRWKLGSGPPAIHHDPPTGQVQLAKQERW